MFDDELIIAGAAVLFNRDGLTAKTPAE